jgi:hypothetical protein
MKRLAMISGIAGSIIGILSAIFALNAVGADPVYSVRLWAVWLSLLLAGLTGMAALSIIIRPGIAGLLMVIGGIAGAALAFLSARTPLAARHPFLLSASQPHLRLSSVTSHAQHVCFTELDGESSNAL